MGKAEKPRWGPWGPAASSSPEETGRVAELPPGRSGLHRAGLGGDEGVWVDLSDPPPRSGHWASSHSK